MTISLLSMISVPIWLYARGNKLGPATAFFYKCENRYFLLSNWHVFSGRHPDTGQPSHSSGAIPDEISLMIHSQNNSEYFKDRRIPLQHSNGEVAWFQHEEGQDIDIACIPFSGMDPQFKVYTIQDHGEADIMISVGADVMIVGYPRGLAAQGILPIWKRGTIAAEPEVERLDDVPIYLVDAATREGMSGSPVYIYSGSGAQMSNGEVHFHNGPVAKFIGMYAGRVGSELDMQLGRVWKREVINEMCYNLHRGKYIIR